MIHEPETRYARSGGASIAYQVFGDGPLDIVVVPGWFSHVELHWEDPSYSRFLQRLGELGRVLILDRRGTGLSDRVSERELPTVEERMDDVLAVMDAAGSERAALVAWSEGGPMCLVFAASHPERMHSLVVFGSGAAFRRSPDHPEGVADATVEAIERMIGRSWGTGRTLAQMSRAADEDPTLRRWWARFERLSASPGAASSLLRMALATDVRHVLRSGGGPVRVASGRCCGSRSAPRARA